MKKLLVLTIIWGLTVSMTLVFAHGSKSHGDLLQDLGIINGDNGDLKETNQLKREELVAILVRIVDTGDIELPDQPYFKDVPQDNWASEILEKAHILGITDGISPNTFGFGQVVDQQQATTFLLKTLGYKPNWQTVIKDAKVLYQIDLDQSPDVFLRQDMFELTNDAMMVEMANNNGILLDHVISDKNNKVRQDYIKTLSELTGLSYGADEEVDGVSSATY